MTETTTPKRRKGDWLTIRQMAGALGVTAQGFRASYLRELNPGDVRQAKGVATTVYAPAAVELLVARRVQAALREAAAEQIENGPPSKELEKLRRVKRRREEIALGKDIREVESRAAVWAEVAEAMNHIERFAREQILQHGNGTADAWAETLAEVNAVSARYAPPGARSRTLHIETDNDETLEIPLSIDEAKHE